MQTKITLILFLLLLSLIGSNVFAQVQINAASSYQPTTLEQGGAFSTYKVDILNNNATTLKAIFLQVLPAGMEYVVETVTGATQLSIANLQSPALNSLIVGNTLQIAFSTHINCGFSSLS